MPEQLWLPGLEAPPTPTDGLFFAVFPDANTAASISKLAQQLCGEARVRSKPLASGVCTSRCVISAFSRGAAAGARGGGNASGCRGSHGAL